MSVIYNARQYDFKVTGVNVTVPNNPTARCMYYLSCVNSVLDIHEISNISRLIDYSKYYSLSFDEKKSLLVLCALFNIQVLDDKVFFETNQLVGSQNEFIELGSTQLVAATDSEIFIGGIKRDVLKIMLYKRSWLLNNHINALVQLKNEIEQNENRLTYIQANLNQRPIYTSPPVNYARHSPPDDDCSCCTII